MSYARHNPTPTSTDDIPSTSATYIYGKRRPKAMEITVRGKQRDDMDPKQMAQVVIMLARQLQAEAESKSADTLEEESEIRR